MTTSNVPQDLAKLGFEVPSITDKPRLLVGSQGLDKTGKTEFWLSAPGPIGCINLDIGLEGVVEKWTKRGKKVWVATYNIPPVGANGKPLTQNDYIQFFLKTRAAYEGMLTNKDIRTVVVDTGSDWWELAKLAEFGKVNPAVDIKQAYQALNQLFRSLIRRAYDTDKNLIITHKMKEKYTSKVGANGKAIDSWDGSSYKKVGFGEDHYLIQVNVEHTFRDGQFGIKILNCRHDMSLAGYEMAGEECNFTGLGQLIYPDSKAEDWL